MTTTTSTILLVKTSSGRGNKPGLTCNPLAAQKGWLGGWQKKVTTMLFNSVPHAPSGWDNVRANRTHSLYEFVKVKPINRAAL